MMQGPRLLFRRLEACALLFVSLLLQVACGSSSGAAGAGGAGMPEGGGSATGGSGAAGSGTGGSGAGGSTHQGGQAGSAGMPSSPECQGFAQAYCERQHACSISHFDASYTSLDDCQQAQAATCQIELAAPGTSLGADNLPACSQATHAQTCDDYHLEYPAKCAPPGSLAIGSACEFNSQCVSTFCSISQGSWCGKCVARGKAGETCDRAQLGCQLGLQCARSMSTDWQCSIPAAKGMTCTSASQCAGALVCLSGQCADGQPAGQTCDPTNDTCDNGSAVYCNQTSTGFVCQASSSALPGAACDYTAGKGCAGSVCVDAQGKPASGAGTCSMPIADGAPCTGVGGRCSAPAQCVAGVCARPVAAASCH
jgi:hypothetical protein